jgi:hypothetical protein
MKVFRLNEEIYYAATSFGSALDTELEATGNHMSDVVDEDSDSYPMDDEELKGIVVKQKHYDKPEITAFELLQEHIKAKKGAARLFGHHEDYGFYSIGE